MRSEIRLTLFVTLIALVAVASPRAALAQTTTITLDGLAEGQIVSSVPAGTGSAGVFGTNPGLGSTNGAIIFDAECGGGCTGDDPDLFFPGQGNVLIVAENLNDGNGDGLVDDPDDADEDDASITFDFTTVGPAGTVTVDSVWVGDTGDDVPGGGSIQVFGPGGVPLGTFPLPPLADNEAAVIPIGVSGVATLVFNLSGSGAIDTLIVTPDSPATETPPPPLPTDTPVPPPTDTPPPATDTPSPSPTLPVGGVTETPFPTDTPPPLATETPPPPLATETPPPLATDTPGPSPTLPVGGVTETPFPTATLPPAAATSTPPTTGLPNTGAGAGDDGGTMLWLAVAALAVLAIGGGVTMARRRSGA